MTFLSASAFREIPLRLIKAKLHQFDDAKKRPEWMLKLDRPPFLKAGRIWWPPSCVNIRVIEASLSIGIAPLLRYRCHLRCRLPYYYFRLLQELPSTHERHAREIELQRCVRHRTAGTYDARSALKRGRDTACDNIE